MFYVIIVNKLVLTDDWINEDDDGQNQNNVIQSEPTQHIVDWYDY